MSIADILSKILESALEEAREIRSQGETAMEDIITSARAEAQSRKEELLRRGEAAAREEQENYLAGLRLEARKEVLAIKKELLNGVFNKVEESFLAQTPEEYAVFLVEMIDPGMVGTAAEIEVGTHDMERCGKGFPQLLFGAVSRRYADWDFTMRHHPGHFKAGISIIAGTIVHNLSLESLLAESREDWEIEVAKTLFSS